MSFQSLFRPRIQRLNPFRISSLSSDNLETRQSGAAINANHTSLLSQVHTVDDLLELERLRNENLALKQSLEALELENERLHRTSRIVIETFEGEGQLREAKEKWKDGSEMDLPGEDFDIYNDPTLWCDELEDGACPLEPTISFGAALRDRAYWLVGLLVLQSLSGFILSRNEALLENHPFSKFCGPSLSKILDPNARALRCSSPFVLLSLQSYSS